MHVFHKMQVHHGGGNHTGELDEGQLSRFSVISLERLLEFRFQFGDISTDGHLLVSQSLQTVQLGNSALSDLTSFGVSNTFSVGLQSRKQQGQEWSSTNRVINKLTHVVNDDGSLTLGGGRLFSESAQQQGNDHGQSRGFDGLDESHTSHLVHDFRHFLGLGDGGKNLSSHVLNISVSNNFKSLLHGIRSSSLDLLLRVPHAGSDLGHNKRQRISQLLRGDFLKSGDALKSEFSDLPLLLDGKGSENGGQKRFHGEWVNRGTYGKCCFRGGSPDISAVGTGLLKT